MVATINDGEFKGSKATVITTQKLMGVKFFLLRINGALVTLPERILTLSRK